MPLDNNNNDNNDNDNNDNNNDDDNNNNDLLIDRHNCCIDSDIVERKAFFMEVICKLYFFQ